jgi:hypothetical protein
MMQQKRLKKFTTLLLAHKRSLETMRVCSARRSSKGSPDVDSDPLANPSLETNNELENSAVFARIVPALAIVLLEPKFPKIGLLHYVLACWDGLQMLQPPTTSKCRFRWH